MGVRVFRINELKVVAQTFPERNQLARWLRQLAELNRVA
jgi:hypothetical protein